MLKPDIAVY